MKTQTWGISPLSFPAAIEFVLFSVEMILTLEGQRVSYLVQKGSVGCLSSLLIQNV